MLLQISLSLESELTMGEVGDLQTLSTEPVLGSAQCNLVGEGDRAGTMLTQLFKFTFGHCRFGHANAPSGIL